LHRHDESTAKINGSDITSRSNFDLNQFGKIIPKTPVYNYGFIFLHLYFHNFCRKNPPADTKNRNSMFLIGLFKNTDFNLSIPSCAPALRDKNRTNVKNKNINLVKKHKPDQ
jgi:hypothetical protein